MLLAVFGPLGLVNDVLDVLVDVGVAELVVVDDGLPSLEAADVGQGQLGDDVVLDLANLLGLHALELVLAAQVLVLSAVVAVA